MEFISVRDLRGRLAEVLKNLSDDDVVVTSNGAPVALLTRVTPASLEFEMRARQQARATLAMMALQLEAAHQGLSGMSEEEVDSEIAEARREREKRG